MAGFYLFVSSTDSVDLYPANTFDNFIVDLGRTYDLTEYCGWREKWNMALVEAALHTNEGESQHFPQDIIVTCDLASPSFIYGTERCILRPIVGGEFSHSASLYQSYYIGLSQLRFHKLRIELKDRNLSPLDLSQFKGRGKQNRLSCTIHFQRL